jgi:thiamine-phosphate pyrophosphorylase
MVSDRRRLPPGRALAEAAAMAARAGVDLIQVREKDLDGGPLRRIVEEVLQAVAGTGARVLVSRRPDVAVAAGAHGVQLPEDGLPVADVRRAFPGLMIGASRHSLEGVRLAGEQGADFVVFGPVFPTPGKEGAAHGLEALGRAVRVSSVAVHAIGGIDADRVREVLSTGAGGIAAIRPFLEGAAAARRLRAAMG